MGKGFLRIELFTGDHGLKVTSDNVLIKQNGNILYRLSTDENGITKDIPLDAPDIPSPDVSLQPPPRALYDVEVTADGFKTETVGGVQIFDGITSVLPVQMIPAVPDAPDNNAVEIEIPYGHGADMDRNNTGGDIFQQELSFGGVNTAELPTANEIAMPQYVVVHLGSPNAVAPDVRVSFKDYIKNVASSEIYPTWHDSALRANIMCQISFILNRIYTEMRRRGGIAVFCPDSAKN